MEQAQITYSEPDNHCAIHYAYSLGGHAYKGIGTQCESMLIGTSVTIYYLPSDPSVSCYGSPKYLFENELYAALAGAVLFSSMILWRILTV